MSFLDQFRAKTGDQYANYTDVELARAFHAKYQAEEGIEVDFTEFSREFGLPVIDTPPPVSEWAEPQGVLYQHTEAGPQPIVPRETIPDAVEQKDVTPEFASPFERDLDIEALRQATYPDDTWTAVKKAFNNIPEDFMQQYYGLRIGAIEPMVAGMTATQEEIRQQQQQERESLRFLPGAAAMGIQPEEIEPRREPVPLAARQAVVDDYLAAIDEKYAALAESQKDRDPLFVEPGSVAYYASAGVSSMANTMPAIVAGVFMGPEVSLLMFYSQAKGKAYLDGREAGLAPEMAADYATYTGLAEAIPELIPLSQILKPGVNFFSRIVRGSAAEIVQEEITEALQIGLDRGYINEDMTWAEARSRLIDAGVLAGIIGPTQAALAHPLVKAKERVTQGPERLAMEMNRELAVTDFTAEEEDIIARLDPEAIIPDSAAEAAALEQIREGKRIEEEMVRATEPVPGDRRVSPERAAAGDRRQDLAERKRVAEMTPDEMRTELLTSDVTGIPNRRAYEEAEPLPVQVSIDADSLKWVNDNMGPESGDQLLRTIGQVLAEETGQAYHISGDEFMAQTQTNEEAEALMERVNARLADAEITIERPDGEIVTKTGLAITHGLGDTKNAADFNLKQEKVRREAAGERAPRGEPPPGIARRRAERQQDIGDRGTEEAGVTKGRDEKWGIDVELKNNGDGTYTISTSDENQRDIEISQGMGGVYYNDLVLNEEGDFVPPSQIVQAGSVGPENTPWKGSPEEKQAVVDLVAKIGFASQTGDKATVERLENELRRKTQGLEAESRESDETGQKEQKAQPAEPEKKPEAEEPAKVEKPKPKPAKVRQAIKREKAEKEPKKEEIQAGRDAVQKELEDEKVKPADVNRAINSGIPVDAVADGVVNATQNLQDALGVPVKKGDIQIEKPKRAKEPGIFVPLQSPTRLMKKYPALEPYVKDAEQAHETQERLRARFQRRLNTINKLLKDPERELLTEIRLTEDFLGREFSDEILKNEFKASDNVIKAHKLMRSAYDKALSLANNVRELRDKPQINRREGYVPHFFHDWFVLIDGEIKTSARTLREAVSYGNKQARQGKEVLIRPKEFTYPGEEVQAAVIGDGSYFKLKKNVEETFELTGEEAKDLLSNVARLKGRSRFVGNFLHRKGVGGYEKNLQWVDRHYFNMMSRYVALDGFKRKSISRFERHYGSFEKEQKGLAKYIKNYINDINGNPTQIEELINNSIANTPAIGKFLGAYLGDRPALQLAGSATNAVAIAKLGLYNISSALVNATQFINAQALIGPRWISEGVGRALAVDAEIAKRKITKPTGKAKQDIGILTRAGVDTQLGLESGAGYSRQAQMGRLFRASLAFFSGVERLLRQSTTLGAYHKGLSQGMDKQQAIDFAKEINTKVNFDYSVVDAPGFIRRSGPLGQVLFQFKKFPVKQMEFMFNLKGAEHFKFWAPILLISGYFGLPGTEALTNLIRGLFDFDPEEELKKDLMTWAGDDPERQRIVKTIMYGIFSQPEFGGVDISRRVGAGDFIPSEMKDLAGPFFSSTVRAAQMASEREWAETLRAIATAPGNIAVALQNEEEIKSPYDRMRKVVDATPEMRVKKALGFRPVEEAIETDVSRVIRGTGRKRRDRQTKAIDDIIMGILREDEARMQRGFEAIGKYNLQITQTQLKNEMERKKLSRAQRAIINADILTRAETAGVIEFFQTVKEKQDKE